MPSRRGRRGGRRVRRGETAGNHHPIEDAAVSVADALTPEGCDRILAWWERTNPRRRGARVSDIIDLLSDGDVFLTMTESFWDARGERLADDLGDAYRVISPAAVAAVILLGLTQSTADVLPADVVASLPFDDYATLTEQLARAAAAGQTASVPAPAAESLAAWIDDSGRLAVRHPIEEEMLLEISGECDSCVHPAADHDRLTGACLRINPVFGPCPCEHSPAENVTAQQHLFERARGQQPGDHAG